MKVNRVIGTITSFVRREKDFLLTIETQCVFERNDKVDKSTRKIEVSFYIDKLSMYPVNDYEQNCMMLLEEFNDTTILFETSNEVRESYFIGRLIDKISGDILTKTKLTQYYESFSDIYEKNDERLN